MHGSPSTSSRTSSGCRSSTAVTTPRRRLSAIARGVHEPERDVDHPLEILDGDVLVWGVDLRHAVGEIDAGEPPLVEDVRVGGAARKAGARLDPGTADPLERELHGRLVGPEAIAAVGLA